MKIAHESFTEKYKLEDITPLDKYKLDKSKDYLVKKLVRDINNECHSDTKKAPRDVAELMFFSAEWCGHCKDFKPVWKKLVKEMDKPKYNNKIILQNYDNDKDGPVFKKYNVKQFPTLLLKLDDGTTKEFNGDRDVKSLKSFIDTELNID